MLWICTSLATLCIVAIIVQNKIIKMKSEIAERTLFNGITADEYFSKHIKAREITKEAEL